MMRCHQARNSDGPVSCVMGISLGCFDIQNSVLLRPLHTIRMSSSYVYGSCVPAFSTTWVKKAPASAASTLPEFVHTLCTVGYHNVEC